MPNVRPDEDSRSSPELTVENLATKALPSRHPVVHGRWHNQLRGFRLVQTHARVVRLTVELKEDGTVKRLGPLNHVAHPLVRARRLVQLVVDGFFAGCVQVPVKPTI